MDLQFKKIESHFDERIAAGNALEIIDNIYNLLNGLSDDLKMGVPYSIELTSIDAFLDQKESHFCSKENYPYQYWQTGEYTRLKNFLRSSQLKIANHWYLELLNETHDFDELDDDLLVIDYLAQQAISRIGFVYLVPSPTTLVGSLNFYFKKFSIDTLDVSMCIEYFIKQTNRNREEWRSIKAENILPNWLIQHNKKQFKKLKIIEKTFHASIEKLLPDELLDLNSDNRESEPSVGKTTKIRINQNKVEKFKQIWTSANTDEYFVLINTQDPFCPFDFSPTILSESISIKIKCTNVLFFYLLRKLVTERFIIDDDWMKKLSKIGIISRKGTPMDTNHIGSTIDQLDITGPYPRGKDRIISFFG